MAFIIITVGVDHRDLKAVYQSDRVYSDFTIVEAIIFPFDGRTIEYPDRIWKGDCVSADIRKVLVRVPGELHACI
jgi:hypothetical protein